MTALAAARARGAAQTQPWWETRRFAAVALVLTALPLVQPAIPPLTDLPGHMAQYRVMLGTDADLLGRWYYFDWRPVGNLGVDLLVAVLAPLIGLEPAVKLIVLLIPVLTAAGMLWLSREVHGRVEPTALFALPLAYNFPFHFGFVNFTLAAALALNALALWMRMGRLRQVRWRAAVFVPVSLLLWAGHLFGWAILAALAWGVETSHRREEGLGWSAALGRGGIDCLPLAPPLLAFIAWRPGGAARAGDYWETLRIKPGWLVMILRDRWKLFDCASVAVLAALVYAGFRSPLFAVRRSLWLGAAMLTAAFASMPFMDAYADMRIAPYLAIAAVLAVAPAAAMPPRARAALALAGMAFLGLRTAATTMSLLAADADWTKRLAVLDRLPRGDRVAALVEIDCAPPWAQFRLTHLASLAVVRRASFANDGFAMGPDALVSIAGPAGARFATDPSQLVEVGTCPRGHAGRTMADALRELPREQFDHLWLLPRDAVPPAIPFAAPVARSGPSILYRIDRPAR